MGRMPGRGGARSALDTQPEPYIEKVNALAMVSWTCFANLLSKSLATTGGELSHLLAKLYG